MPSLSSCYYLMRRPSFANSNSNISWKKNQFWKRRFMISAVQAMWQLTQRTIRDVWIRNRQVNRRQRETLFVHVFPHDKRLQFYVLYIRELWRNFVTYIVINSLYIMCNQVNFCYEWTGCEKGFREPCLFACLLPNKTSSDARRVICRPCSDNMIPNPN